MKQATVQRNRCNFILRPFSLLILFSALSLSGFSFAALTAVPATVTIDALDQGVIINLLDDGIPVPAAEIRRWRFLAGESDYQRMLDITKRDGALVIAPTRLEMGSYLLIVETARGTAQVQVYAPLRNHRNILEMEAAAQGTTVDAVKEQRGLSQPGRSASVEIQLPPVYYEGQTMQVAMPLEDGLSYRWSINGELIKEGPGEHRLTYVFKAPGDYTLHFEEFRNGHKVAEARATTRAVALPEIPWTVRAGNAFTLRAPAHYAAYAWTIDGALVSEQEQLTYTLTTPGDYRIECIASGAPGGSGGTFVRHRYFVEVTPR
jgi:hypothetical protein